MTKSDQIPACHNRVKYTNIKIDCLQVGGSQKIGSNAHFSLTTVATSEKSRKEE